MCGIAGIASSDPTRTPLADHLLRRMTDVIEHRGPDDDGHFSAPGVAMGMRRLSIIDLDTGAQPLANEDGRIWTVFNGEIFNFRELRAELRARGHAFSTSGDTETIVHLYEEYGPDFAHRLRGMFAIAVWDAPRRRLTLVRDRMGVKPLYLHDGPRGLSFASEVKSLLAGGLVEPRLDPVGAELFLAHGFVPGPMTLFDGVTKLAPGTTLVWENGAPATEKPYWRLPAETRPGGAGAASPREDQERLIELLRASVRARMISDVPLGVMLSGGLDSSLIAALMTEHASGPIKTFSIGFREDAAADELDDARSVAARLETEHHELRTSAVDHPALLDEVLWHQEDPVADVSSLGFLLLSRLARETVTVALSGQGADELLGGYRKHQFAAGAGMIHRVPGLPMALRAGARLAPAGSNVARAARALGSGDAVERLLAASRVVDLHHRLELLEPGFRTPDAEQRIVEQLRRLAAPVAGASPLRQALHLDMQVGLVDNMLLYFDKISMAASLEVRVPFMDHDVVEFCMSLPDERRVPLLRRKDLLKRASRGLVDDAIITKKKRGFFHSALGAWLAVNRDGVVRESLLDARARGRGIVRPEAVAELLAAAGRDGKKVDQRLFSVVLLERWHRLWTDDDAPGRRLWHEARSASPAHSDV